MTQSTPIIFEDFVDVYDIPEHDFYPSQSGGERSGKHTKAKKIDKNIYGKKHIRIALARLRRDNN